ncbi:DUF4349 domain-containing protein [Candidatus Uhrbacteria bacterium]|nr:DUF4349 domain-containing protein [Candidatus Uhrbacteria bacterium]
MPPSPSPVRPARALVYVIISSIVLTLVTVGLIWKATEQVLELKQSNIGYDTAGTVGGYGGGAVGMPATPPMMTEEGVAESGMIARDEYVGKSIMMPYPSPAPGATPEDRNRVGQKIIRNGSLTLRVDDAAKRLEEARMIAEQAGGFVASANLTDRAGVKTAYATLRIPTDKFRAVADSLKRLASTVFDESESGQDVTDQYVDLDARLKAAKAEEAQYMEILKNARSIEDTLNVAARLGEVRSRIEQMQGQMRGLEDRTSYATLTVTMTEEARVEAPTRVWKPLETFKEAMRALVESLQGMVDALIAFAVFFVGLVLPVLIVLGLAAWFVRWLIRRMMGNR